jgi:hypothetical protein
VSIGTYHISSWGQDITFALKNSILLFALLSVLLSGCGVDFDSGTSSSGQGLVFSETVSEGGRPLTDSELGVALRICYAFRSKRSKFLSQFLDSNFSFNFTKKSCSENVVSTSLVSTSLKQPLPGGPLSYESLSASNHFKLVETDINGDLVDVCSLVFKGETPMNVMTIHNETYEFRFLASTYDTVEILIGANTNPQNPRQFVVNRQKRMEVLTNQSSSGEYLGMVVKASLTTRCSDDVRSTQVQEFIAP